jgi:6-phosphogluconolactonase (cycloisomerase 2 family)
VLSADLRYLPTQCGLRHRASSQQYLYGSTSSQLAGFSTVTSGALTSVAGAPFSDPQFQGGMMAIDGKGQFLFLIDHATSGVWMFQIHSDGTLARAPGSPFFAPTISSAGPAPSSPISVATELSGQFVYVGYQSGYSPGDGAIVEFQISVADPANPQLAPVPAQESSYLQAASPLQMVTDPKGTHLYVALRGVAAGGTNVYAIDSTTGAFTSTGTAGGGNANEQAIALDPSGQFFFDGWGSSVGFIERAQISPAGTTIPLNAPINLGSGNIPHAILVDGLGKFLYVDVLSAQGTYAFPIDPTGNLGTPPVGPETIFNFQTGTAVADPKGPYIYSLQPDGLHAFVVDATIGAVSDVVGSPFSVTTGSGTGIGGLAISGASGQTATGALAQLFPPTQDFGMVFLGQSGVAKPPPNLTNTGSVGLNLASVSVTGANAADFIAAPVCSLPAFLPTGSGSNATCSINVTFVPTAMGHR